MKEVSEDAVSQGLPPTWPISISTPSCANVTYYPRSLYTHQVNLGEGPHTLHIGNFLRDASASQWKGGASVGIVGLVTPVFPTFVDHRKERYGCVTGSGSENACSEDVLWVDQAFEVGIGQGGAIASQNYGSIQIDRTAFRNNVS